MPCRVCVVVVHSTKIAREVKGSAHMFGATRLADVCAAMEVEPEVRQAGSRRCRATTRQRSVEPARQPRVRPSQQRHRGGDQDQADDGRVDRDRRRRPSPSLFASGSWPNPKPLKTATTISAAQVMVLAVLASHRVGHRLGGELLGRGAEEPVVVALGGHRPAEAEASPSSSKPTSASRMPLRRGPGGSCVERCCLVQVVRCRWSWLWSPFSSPGDVVTAGR
jgi:hypothetical protein